MDLVSAPQPVGMADSAASEESARSANLRSAVVDWLSARQGLGIAMGAEVAVAEALERAGRPPVVCARLRRGVREEPVRTAFHNCCEEFGGAQVSGVALLIERHPIRRTLADAYCAITTNDPAEHHFVITEALQSVGLEVPDSQLPASVQTRAAGEALQPRAERFELSAPNDSAAGDLDAIDRSGRNLAIELTEIAVAFPAARDSLEELLWQHRR